MARTADPNWPQGYSPPRSITLSNKTGVLSVQSSCCSETSQWEVMGDDLCTACGVWLAGFWAFQLLFHGCLIGFWFGVGFFVVLFSFFPPALPRPPSLTKLSLSQLKSIFCFYSSNSLPHSTAAVNKQLMGAQLLARNQPTTALKMKLYKIESFKYALIKMCLS